MHESCGIYRAAQHPLKITYKNPTHEKSIMEWLMSPEIWVAFLTLTALEIVLGIDNIIMIAILVGRMPAHLQARTRFFGLALAMVTRIMLLLSITWIMRLTSDLFDVFGQGVSGRDLILFFGGLFLLWKSSTEMYHSLEGEEENQNDPKRVAGGFIGTIIQIAIIDIVFSLDSVITAVGMVSNVPVMVAAIIVAVIVMMLCAGAISGFIDRHPSLKMLALSFLVVVGTVLIAEAFDVHVPKGYVYFAMAFSLGVEALNIRMRTAHGRKRDPVTLRKDAIDR
jgi:predicted tellurium resistance membrane protein TerC